MKTGFYLGVVLGEKIPPNFFTASSFSGLSLRYGLVQFPAWQFAAHTRHLTY